MFSKVIAKIFAIEQLTVNDVAFVQRSNGEWQYSVVVEAASDTNYCEEQCNTLSVNSRGCTKTIPKRRCGFNSFDWSGTMMVRNSAKVMESNGLRLWTRYPINHLGIAVIFVRMRVVHNLLCVNPTACR
jgi:hypothetical protein